MRALHAAVLVLLPALTLMTGVSAQDDIDCTRYRIAGLTCPSRSGPVKAAVVPPPPARPLAPVVAPVNPADPSSRSAAGASLSAPPFLRAPLAPSGGAPPANTAGAALSTSPRAAGSSAGSPGAQPPGNQALEAASREQAQVVVYWATTEEADTALSRMALQSQAQPVSRSQLEGLGGVMAVFQLESLLSAAEFRTRVALEFPAAAVDLNTLYRPLQQQAMPRIYLTTKIDRPKLDTAQATAALVRIGIVDGPVALIPALDGVSLSRKSFLAAGDVPASSVHATAIASLISGRDLKSGFTGVAGPALLYSAEVMRSAGTEDATSSAVLVRALDWLLTQGIQVVNLSLGGPGDAVMAKAFARLGDLAVVVVAAAGNGGPTAPAAYPAAYPGVLAATATDAADNAYSGANRGDYIALAAPGVDVWVPDAKSGHYVTGTSFSAAVITSAVALLLAQTPGLGSRKTLAQLCRTARDLGTPGTDPVFGCGLVQIAASLADGRQ